MSQNEKNGENETNTVNGTNAMKIEEDSVMNNAD